MERINFTGKAARKVAGGLLLLATIMLTACNGASGDGATSTGTGTGQGTGNASGPVSIAVGLSPNSSVTLGAQTSATATLLDSNKKPIKDALISFTTDNKLATLTPSSGKVLTNENGQATISLTAASVEANGAGVLQVDVSGSAGGSTFTATGAANYTIGNTSISLSEITLGQSPIDAYATTSVKVKVLINGVATSTPQVVSFSSGCANSSKAKLDATVPTNNSGEASATYTDNGCAGSDTITASLNIGSSAPRTATIKINDRKSSTFKFVSNTPAEGVITLKGFGSEVRPQTARVVFQLVDANNNGIQGKAVEFSLDVAVGGVALQATTGITDIDGKATAIVIAGDHPTPVRVTAKADGLSSQSSGLSISTGFPDMDSLSLSANRYNINGWNYDGATATVTLRFADHFNNPVPDGTAINFITDGGLIGDGKTTGQCQSVNSQCSVTLSSQNPRPTNGRVHIVAYAIGEESFVDRFVTNEKINIFADQLSELVDINGISSDIGEAYIDVNENGQFDSNIDQLVDFNNNKKYDGPDQLYNGSLCLTSWEKCAPKRSLHVFSQQTFIFSSHIPLINTVTNSSPFDNIQTGIRSIRLQCGASQNETLWVRENNAQNAMPDGTVISFSTKDAGSISTAPTEISSSTKASGHKTGNSTVFGVTVKANKCSDLKDPFVKGTWELSVAVPDHGGGKATTTRIEANLCVYATDPNLCN